MSRRTMSEKANCGLMLCEGIGNVGSPTGIPGSGGSPTISSKDRREETQLAVLNSLVPGGVADKNKFRPLAQLLENIGQSNIDRSTPINTYNLSPESVKLFQDFMDRAGVLKTGESPKRAEVVNTIQRTFGLTDEQVKGLLERSTRGAVIEPGTEDRVGTGGKTDRIYSSFPSTSPTEPWTGVGAKVSA